jgi:RHS repeat-associated protein
MGVDEYFQPTDPNDPANFLTDALVSAIALTGAGGNVLARYTYDPYGNTTMTGSSLNPYQFTGRENDGTGPYYYRARYYSPALSRFVSEDPWGLRAGVDFYAYAFGNPLQWADPSGLDVLRCERPLNIPVGRNLACHTFLFSTQSNSGWGLTAASGSGSVWTFGTGGSVPGKLEPDNPFPPGQPQVIGRYKPGYSCSDVSKNECVEKCVNSNFKPPFPNYQLARYQCNDWADDVLHRCKKACGQCAQ